MIKEIHQEIICGTFIYVKTYIIGTYSNENK